MAERIKDQNMNVFNVNSNNYQTDLQYFFELNSENIKNIPQNKRNSKENICNFNYYNLKDKEK